MTEVQHGELFVIQYESGQRRRYIVQVKSSYAQLTSTGLKQQVWWTCDLRGFRQISPDSTFGDGIPEFAGLSDGPYKAHNRQSKLLGRVVGFAATSLGGLLEQSAGWENEAEGNAAFDPAEYLDEMIATGHRPYLLRGRDGHMIYGEQPHWWQRSRHHASGTAGGPGRARSPSR